MNRRFLVKLVVLLIVSVLLSAFLHVRWGIVFADVFFVCAMVFIVVASMEIAGGLGFFSGMSHGVRFVFRIIRNSAAKNETVRGNKRGGFSDALRLIVIGLVLFLVSVLLS